MIEVSGHTAMLASLPEEKAIRQMMIVIAITFLISAAVSVAVSKGKHFAWAVLLIIAIFVGLGAR